MTIDRRTFLGAAGGRGRHGAELERASVLARSRGEDRRHADHRLSRAAAGVGSDHGPLVGQPAAHVDLQMRLRPVRRSEPRSVLHPRPADQVGLERGQDQDRDDRARGRQVAGRPPGDPRRHHLEPGAGRQEGDRQPGPVRLVEHQEPEGERQRHHGRRGPVPGRHLQVDGVPHSLCHPAALLPAGRQGRLREEADGIGPLHDGRVPARLVRPPEGQRQLLGRQARRSRTSSSSSSPTRPRASPRSRAAARI